MNPFHLKSESIAYLAIPLEGDEDEHKSANERAAIDLEVAELAHDVQVEGVLRVSPHLQNHVDNHRDQCRAQVKAGQNGHKQREHTRLCIACCQGVKRIIFIA